MNIGGKIRQARERAGLSQPELAELCGWGYNQGRISHYETNRRSPSIDDLLAICGALGLSLDQLVYGDQLPATVNVNAGLERRAQEFARQFAALPERQAALLLQLIRELQGR